MSSEMWPRISIVTPSYNQAQYLERTIKSVLEQKYPNLEYIIIDGGSSDNSADIIKKYLQWLTYWISEPDKGQSHAINKGFEQATGEVFGWLNSDDIYLPGSLRLVGESFRNSNVDFVAGQRYFIDSQDNIIGKSVIPIENPLHYMLYGLGALNQECCFWRAGLHRAIGGFDENLWYSLDYDYLLRICGAAQGRLVYLPEFLGCMRMHPEQKSSSNRPFVKLRDSESQLARQRFITRHSISSVKLFFGGLWYLPQRRFHEQRLHSLFRIPRIDTIRKVIGSKTLQR